MADKSKKADFTDDEMKEFDRVVQKTGRFPADTIFDPSAEARGESRYRKVTADDKKAADNPAGAKTEG